MSRSVSFLLPCLALLVASLVAACSGPQAGELPEETSTTEARGTSDANAGVSPTSTSAATVTTIASSTPKPSTPAAATQSTGTPTAVGQTASPTSTARPLATATTTTPVDLGRIALGVEPVASGFTQPLVVTHAGDGSGRIFVAEKIGKIKLLDGTVVLDITDRVISFPITSYEQEMGLIGLEFHPRFEDNGYFYVHYINRDQDHIISRFELGSDGVADRDSETILLTHDQPDVNFNGGMLTFGPDGYLYIGLGTGGAAIPLQNNAQDLGSLLGKILRIDVDRGDPYEIPDDNPFVDRPGARGEVWAIGLRNPYRFTFDRANGDLYIAQPGQFKSEWLQFQPGGSPGGRNFGWPMFEGTECWKEWTGPCDPAGLERPIYERPSYGDGNCVIIGGDVYRGPSYPNLQGVYLFGDYCSARIWGLGRNASGAWVSAVLLQLPPGPDAAYMSAFGVDEAGEMYAIDIGNGIIYRVTAGER